MHIGQFISNVVALGHEVWTWPGNNYPAGRRMPSRRIERIMTLRQMDVVYVRIEWAPPKECHWSIAPYRHLIGSPVIVWEFNTVPEQGLILGRPESEIKKAIEEFRHYGRGCDLAICVSKSLAEYVKDKLGIKHVLTVPNGSDPELFRPDAPIAKRMLPFQDEFNVVWIGSAKQPWNDFDMLREAAQIVWGTESGKNIIFHIIAPDLAGLMSDLPPNTYYWGAERYEKLPNWLAGMDVGLALYYPGAAEYGSPLKVFDYMSSGLAVVSTYHPQIEEVLEEVGQSSLLVPANDAPALAHVLLDLALNREQARKLGQVCRQRIIDFYNWRRATEDTLCEIDILLKERK
ncbi:glycosyltransferase [Thermodesulfobacteriota bacterium]